jgi:holliday junction DNA helicase RuvA
MFVVLLITMIASLTGSIKKINKNSAIIETSGIGYKIFTTENFLKKIKDREVVSVRTHLAVKEDALDLYGFDSEEELEFFEMLLTISGIGPKTALNILNVAPVKIIKEATSSGDITHLVKVSGIGRKNAQKIVLELKDKLAQGDTSNENLKDDVEALEALKVLGYSQSQSREALQKVPQKTDGASQKIREALKILSR